jgi:hypothetical protein
MEGFLAGGDYEDDTPDRPARSEGRAEPDIALYATESTAARAFASLIAPMPEPETAPSQVKADANAKPRTSGMTPEMIRRIADRAEAAAGKK